MKKFVNLLAIATLIFVSSCNMSEKKEDPSGETTPVSPADQHRYNLNNPDKEVNNLDTVHVDSVNSN